MEKILRSRAYTIALTIIIFLAVFLSIYRIRELMTFIGDQGWFYLSAKELVINGNIPLVGIPSSRPWLHQGPFWTYILALFLWLFDFDPVSGAYATMALGALTVFILYFVSSMLFSSRVGLVASLIYATSPLVTFYNRMPYHTSPIPLFVLLFIFSLYRWVQGRAIFFPFTIFFLVVLYNFEIATVVLSFVFLTILFYGLSKERIWAKKIFTKRIIFLSVALFFIPMFPMILHDVGQGFPQTAKFFIWIFYRAVSFFGYNQEHAPSIGRFLEMFNFFAAGYKKLIFPANDFIFFAILLFTLGWILYNIYVLLIKRQRNISYFLIFSVFVTSFTFIFLNQTPSDAYLPILFPLIILVIALLFDYFLRIKNTFRYVVISCLFFIVIGNMHFLLRNNFLAGPLTLKKRVNESMEIIKLVKGQDYNLVGRGEGSQFSSFTMNYQYLTWWLGHPPSKDEKKIRIYIEESKDGIRIKKRE